MQQQQNMQNQNMQQQSVQPQFGLEGGHVIMYHQEQTGLPQVKDATVNDRDRMQDLLAQEKYLTGAYNVAMYEAGHDALYQAIKQNSDTCHQLQRQIFNMMFKKGWYELPVADADAVAHTFNQWQQYQAQLPFPAGQQQQTTATGAQPQMAQQTTATGAQPQMARQTQRTAADQAVQQAVSAVLNDVSQGRVAPGAVKKRTH